jgi:hypothetical protein
MCRGHHAATTRLLDVGGKGHTHASVRNAPSLEMAASDPTVHGTLGDRESSRPLGDRQLRRRERGRRQESGTQNEASVPPPHRTVARSGLQTGGVERGDQCAVMLVTVVSDEIDGETRRSPRHGGRRRAAHAQLVRGARAPVDADAHLVAGGFRDQRDIANERTQETLAIFVRGGRGRPQARQVCGQRLQLRAWGRGTAAACVAAKAASASTKAASEASQRCSRLRATRRFSGSQW